MLRKAAYRLSALFGALSFVLGLVYCLFCVIEIVGGVKTVTKLFSKK